MKKLTTGEQIENLTKVRVLEDGTRVEVLPDGSTVPFTEKSQTDWNRLVTMSDQEIDGSDVPELDERFWNDAKIIAPQNKKTTTIPIDADVLDWFKSQGKGWQTRINNVLQAYYKAHDNSS